MREYLNVEETSSIIAKEVVETGSSKNWGTVDSNNLNIARGIEKHLAKFNIGFDERRARWVGSNKGSRYFNGLLWWGTVKNKVTSTIKQLQKQ